MRMRPLRPLISSSHDSKLRKRLKKPVVRARVRRLDPEEWGSQYLTGMLLEGSSNIILPERPFHTERMGPVERLDEQGSGSRIRARSKSVEAQHISAGELTDNDLAMEASRSLALLSSMFGDDNDEREWGGAESLSDIEMGPRPIAPDPDLGSRSVGEVEDGIEFVAREQLASNVRVGVGEGEEQAPPPNDFAPVEETSQRTQRSKLKDIFVPRTEDGELSHDH